MVGTKRDAQAVALPAADALAQRGEFGDGFDHGSSMETRKSEVYAGRVERVPRAAQA